MRIRLDHQDELMNGHKLQGGDEGSRHGLTNCHVFIDFDGTIAPVDTTDLLLERYADPAWTSVEEDWKAGRIGSRECLVRQIDLVRALPEAVDALLAEIEIDPWFEGFVRLCRRHGFATTVVSDGLDRSVETVLRRAGLDLPYFANHLEWLGGDRWRLGFPHGREDCKALSGNCKCAFAHAAGPVARILVGDGRSDFCIAHRVDLVLAKGKLAQYCRDNGLAYQEFTTFAEASALLDSWFRARQDGANNRVSP